MGPWASTHERLRALGVADPPRRQAGAFGLLRRSQMVELREGSSGGWKLMSGVEWGHARRSLRLLLVTSGWDLLP